MVPITSTETPATAAPTPLAWSGAENATCVAVTGELDIATVPELDRALHHAQANAAVVVVDLSDLEFIDYSAAQLLLVADRRIREAGGRLVVVRGPAEVEWLFQLIGIDRELELVDWPLHVATELEDAAA